MLDLLSKGDVYDNMCLDFSARGIMSLFSEHVVLVMYKDLIYYVNKNNHIISKLVVKLVTNIFKIFFSLFPSFNNIT